MRGELIVRRSVCQSLLDKSFCLHTIGTLVRRVIHEAKKSATYKKTPHDAGSFRILKPFGPKIRRLLFVSCDKNRGVTIAVFIPAIQNQIVVKA